MEAQDALKKIADQIQAQIQAWKNDSYSNERAFANGKVSGLLFAKELLEKVVAEEVK